VKPPAFDYHRPRSRAEVDALLGEYGEDAKILAGGQSLIPILNMRFASPAHLVDINYLEDEPVAPVSTAGDHVEFGPLVRQWVLENPSEVAATVPLLAETIEHVAHPAIRTRGTVAGSIAHADPAAELPAVLTVLDGEIAARSAWTTRTVAPADFFAGPLENSLEPDEWVEAVRFPSARPGEGYAFEEFARRNGDYALCGVACLARLADSGARFAFSYLGMGGTPIRLETEALSENDVASDALDDAVTSVTSGSLRPPEDVHAAAGYRMFLARKLGAVAARRAFAVATAEEAS
jgi:carbon-monoxide dehydrogenase medium subunit